MRGRDYFGADRDWANAYDIRVLRWKDEQSLNNNRNFVTTPMTRAEFDNIFRILNEERMTVLLRRQNEEENQGLWMGIEELNLDDYPERTFERPQLKPFKLPYDTTDEVRMRFRNSVIMMKGHPFYVSDIRRHRGDFWFLVEDAKDEKGSIPMSRIPDFRGCPPSYVQMDTDHVWMTRLPARQNQQGMTNQNMYLRRISSGKQVPFNPKDLVQAIDSRSKTLRWTQHYIGLLTDRIIPEFRLSTEVAAFTKKNVDEIYVAYKGRLFGKLLEGNTVHAIDEDDLLQPWVKKHFDKVGMEITT